MVFPYRTPASIDPELITAHSPALARWIRAVSGAAVLFLLSATAMMIMLMHDIARSYEFTGTIGVPRPGKLASCEAAEPPPAPRAPPPLRAEAPRDVPTVRRAFTPPLGLAELGAVTHDPAALLARAARLRGDGADLTLTRSTLPMPIERALEDAFAPHARIAARFATGGIEIQSLTPGSPASLAGLQRGDVLTAINGYALRSPEAAIDAHRSLLATKTALLEVLRGERRIVLEARFSAPPRPLTAAR
jgi:membrane-associated protease RseP (regulator of RpoE activity)